MTILNDVTTVADLKVGATALIVTQHRASVAATAGTVEAVYQDAPGWCVEYSYKTVGGVVLHGTAYYHHGTDMIDTVSTEEGTL